MRIRIRFITVHSLTLANPVIGKGAQFVAPAPVRFWGMPKSFGARLRSICGIYH
jgi:hypothetical protein